MCYPPNREEGAAGAQLDLCGGPNFSGSSFWYSAHIHIRPPDKGLLVGSKNQPLQWEPIFLNAALCGGVCVRVYDERKNDFLSLLAEWNHCVGTQSGAVIP